MIEKVFARLERDLIRNNNFQTVREMMNAITTYFEKEQSFRNWST